MSGIRELRKLLVRGARVCVRDTPKKIDLHDQIVYVKSEGLVPCKQGGRCAEDRKCNGHAVFVCRTDPANLPGGAGWRAGANKLCLTHLNGLDEEPLTAVRKRKIRAESAPEVRVEPLTPEDIESFRTEVVDSLEDVTWIDLAHAAHEAQDGTAESLGRLILLARRLKVISERSRNRVIEVQDELISIQQLALRELSQPLVPTVAEALEPLEFNPDEEEDLLEFDFTGSQIESSPRVRRNPCI